MYNTSRDRRLESLLAPGFYFFVVFVVVFFSKKGLFKKKKGPQPSVCSHGAPCAFDSISLNQTLLQESVTQGPSISLGSTQLMKTRLREVSNWQSDDSILPVTEVSDLPLRHTAQ